jgi:anti-sigma B factor antagonist
VGASSCDLDHEEGRVSDLHNGAHRSGDTGAVVEVRGDIDGLNADAIGHRIARARRRPGSSVVLDMSDVTFMDSQGLRMLLEARQALADDGGVFRLLRPPQCVLLVLDLTGIRDPFSIEN